MRSLPLQSRQVFRDARSVLYRAVGLSGYEHRGAWDEHGRFKFGARVSLKSCSCPGCGSKQVVCHEFVGRLVHAPPFGPRRTLMFLETPRLDWRVYGTVRTMPLPKVSAGKKQWKSFVRLVVDLRNLMTGAEVTGYLGGSDCKVRDIENSGSRVRAPGIRVLQTRGHTERTFSLVPLP